MLRSGKIHEFNGVEDGGLVVDVLRSFGGMCIEAVIEPVHTGEHLSGELARRLSQNKRIIPLEAKDSSLRILQNIHTSSYRAWWHIVMERRNSRLPRAYIVDPLCDCVRKIAKEQADGELDVPRRWQKLTDI